MSEDEEDRDDIMSMGNEESRVSMGGNGSIGEDEEDDFFKNEDDALLDEIETKYKTIKSLKRQSYSGKKRRRVGDKADDEVADDGLVSVNNALISHNIYKQNVTNFLNKCGSFSSLEDEKMEILIVNTANILHHCSLLWNGRLDFIYGDVSLQLPKDCNLRIYASIYFVVTQLYVLLSSINIKDMLMDFYTMDKSTEKGRKKAIYKKTKERVFFDNLHKFLSIIHKYGLGGKKYKRGLSKVLSEDVKLPRQDIHYITDSPSTRFYTNLLRKFFHVNEDFLAYKEQCDMLIEDALTKVVLEGKGVRLVHMVCIYNVIVIRNLPSQERKRTKRGSDNVLSSVRIGGLLDDKENVSGLLFDKLMNHYMVNLDDDSKAMERRKKNFIKCLQKYLKRL